MREPVGTIVESDILVVGAGAGGLLAALSAKRNSRPGTRVTIVDAHMVGRSGHTAFSNTSQLMFEFMSKNRRAIDALTIKDVIYGEIEDSVPKVNDIEDLLSINQVEFKVLSAEDVLGKAAESTGSAGVVLPKRMQK